MGRSNHQGLLNTKTPVSKEGPVECLGMTFESDEKRREHFLSKLRDGLEELHTKLGGVPFTTVTEAVERMKSLEKWPMGDEPRLRQMAERMRRADPAKDLLQRWKDEVGFPHGEMEDILALSDPPYYTACPNPFIGDFIRHYGKPYDPKADNYHREPFAADVSEGKNDSIYNAHSYHTKVPHKAIVRYILHYTEPGDVILDGFCGTGMTGVATLAADKRRRCILVDLSPAATFISALYNCRVDALEYQHRAESVLQKVDAETRSLYEIRAENDAIGLLESVIWSSVMICPSCSAEISFWELRERQDGLQCPHCQSVSKREKYEYMVETFIDPVSRRLRRRNKKVPVEITFRIGDKLHRRKPNNEDLALLDDSSALKNAPWFPAVPMLGIGSGWGDTYRSGYHRGYENVHDFYFPRALAVLSRLRLEAFNCPRYLRIHLIGLLTSVAFASTHLYKYRTTGGGQPAGNNLYIPALIKEQNVVSSLKRKLRDLVRAERDKPQCERSVAVCTGSSTNLQGIPDNSIDYIFVDPPFGANIMYSESSFLWEAWLKLCTNQAKEAVINKTQKKSLMDYQALMTDCFSEFLRILKPGRWMSVEFHNSQNAVWTGIQEALGHAGFVVADVRTLDKKQGTFKQVTTAGAVKQDLVISCYKPNGGLEDRFRLSAGTEDGVWDFVRTHLRQLPVFVAKDGQAEVIAERQDYLVFDRMVAFHVQRGVTVPLSAAEFYAGLAQRFPQRDGMYFLPDQVAEYDKKRITVGEVLQLQLIVTDESSAIQWLRQQLTTKPQTFQEIHPQFLKEIGGWQKHEKPLELSELLEQNFLRYDGKGNVPSQIHGYLSTNYKDLRNLPSDDPLLKARAKDRWYVPDPHKASDLEKLRERALLREFQEYRESKQRRLKVFRLEAVRAGFKKAWQERDYATIIAVASKIPEDVLQEDPKLLMWYDQALTRSGEE